MEKVLLLEAKYRDALGAIRGHAGLKAAVDKELIWLRGITVGATADKGIRSIPVLRSYTLDSNDRLFPEGCRTPTQKLPVLEWMPIKQFLPVTAPVSAMPGSISGNMRVTLSRSGEAKEDYALLVNLTDWRYYAETAPDVRLRQLSFAVPDKGKALICGKPLPNIPGVAYWLNGQMLLPAGFDFDPPIIAGLIAEQQSANEQVFMLFNADGNWQLIPFAVFQPAKRSAIRLTEISHE